VSSRFTNVVYSCHVLNVFNSFLNVFTDERTERDGKREWPLAIARSNVISLALKSDVKNYYYATDEIVS